MDIDLSSVTNKDFKPTLYMIHKILNQEIVGEFKSRMSLFTNFVLSNKFVLMSGPRASGKTWISDHVVKYFLGSLEEGVGTAYTITMGSKKSAWYQYEKINRASHIVIFELNQVPEGFNEVLKMWGEGKDAEYKVTVNNSGSFKTSNKKLEYKPTVLCLADEQEEEIDEQLWSRLTIIRTDSSLEQNKRVLKHQAMLAKKKKNPKRVKTKLMKKLKSHIHTMPTLNDTEFKHPASDLFIDAIPPFFTDCRRDFPKYLENTYGITRFHWKNRIKRDKMMFVTPQDMFYNHVIYGHNIVESALKCSRIQRDMIEIIKEYNEPAHRKIVQKNLRKIGYSVSAHMCSRHLNDLTDIGYLEKEKQGRKVYYTVGDLFNEFEFTINWEKIVEESKSYMKKEYPNVADEYTKRYCKEPTLIHPFSGKKINLFNIKQSKIDLTESKSNLRFYVKEHKEKEKKKELDDIESVNEPDEPEPELEVKEEMIQINEGDL